MQQAKAGQRGRWRMGTPGPAWLAGWLAAFLWLPAFLQLQFAIARVEVIVALLRLWW